MNAGYLSDDCPTYKGNHTYGTDNTAYVLN